MVRGRGGKGGAEDQYVNDRPYVASSLLSVVLSRWFNSALGGRCERKPELAAAALPLEARLAAVPCRGGEGFLRALFEPLGYEVDLRLRDSQHLGCLGLRKLPFVDHLIQRISEAQLSLTLGCIGKAQVGKHIPAAASNGPTSLSVSTCHSVPHNLVRRSSAAR